MLHRLVPLLLCSALAGCTVADLGVGRDVCPTRWTWGGAGGYADVAWPANEKLLTADILGGPHSGALVSADLWRLVHVEVGLIGAGIGIGPFQIGGGVGFYTPSAPASLHGWNPFVFESSGQHHL